MRAALSFASAFRRCLPFFSFLTLTVTENLCFVLALTRRPSTYAFTLVRWVDTTETFALKACRTHFLGTPEIFTAGFGPSGTVAGQPSGVAAATIGQASNESGTPSPSPSEGVGEVLYTSSPNGTSP